MAPEIINKEVDGEYGCASDIYSLGIMHYCMITGRNPFDGRNFEEVLENNARGYINFELPLLQNLEISEKYVLESLL